MLKQYSKSSLSHTVVYGPPGCGKLTLAKQLISMHMKVPLKTVYKTQLHMHIENDKEQYFSKSNVHFELDLRNFVPSYQNAMVNILIELSKTVNVALNRYKIILIRNSEFISRHVQRQLRMMLENIYTTTRLIFVCSNIDSLEDTFLSRMVCIRVPSPSDSSILSFIRQKSFVDPSVSATSIRQAIRLTNSNITRTVLKLMTKGGVRDELTYLVNEFWNALKKRNPIIQIRETVQKLSTVYTPWICIVNSLMISRVLPKLKDEAQTQHAIMTWNSFVYNYEQETHKEYSIEEFVCKLALIMKYDIEELETSYCSSDCWL
jgi:replication-associated recombination protein RarA